ncbi:UNVERIFIED_CONTAM: hypothetical protein PYX00_003863 [Menopon gallinae]|uniref:BZIP domain-containing protein n=1 Tax=Menopon gallinae TaxID=328185 RepID=A0AAW2I222_9NEOP
MHEEMTTFASDFGSQTLVTDLVHELSTGLEIPFLLSGSPTECDNEYKCNELLFDGVKSELMYDDVFYDKEENGLWMDQDILSPTSVKREVQPMSEVDELQSYLVKNDVLKTYLKTDSSGHGSGSDSSSTEFWPVKSERDTSPVTPCEERVSPDSVIFFHNNELKFIPISQEGPKKNKHSLNRYSTTVRIQPKPNLQAFDPIDNHKCSNQAIMCNVFKDVQKTIKGNKINVDETGVDKKSAILSKKDSEIQILQAKRKQERMIRNRESAYLSRKRKKEYVAHLESQVQELVNENNRLREENHNLKERLTKYEDLESLNSSNRFRNMFITSPRKATALLAVMLTVCLNIGSFSNFLNDRTGSQSDGVLLNGNSVPFQVQNVRHTRSLLWSDPQFEDLKSLANLSKTSCPINQTESIRLESELRRWIGGDEDFSRPLKRNTSKNSDYSQTFEKMNKNQSRSKRKYRIRKMQQASDVEVDVFRMKPHFFNFDTFFEAIHRRDDTFYLVSFSADHLLLPALAHNKTSRPKMSLMLPAFLSNTTVGDTSDQVEMMQIDCEVTNTQLLSVNENDIPSHMRPYSNSTSKNKNSQTEDANQFSQFLVEGLSEKKNSDGKVNGPLGRDVKEFALSNRTSDGKNFQGDVDKSAKPNVYKFTKLHSNLHFNQSIKEKDSKLKPTNQGYFFEGNSGSDSENLNNRSDNSVADGVQFLDMSGKSFLKTLIGPPTLTQTGNLSYGKKPYVKSFRSAMKFLLP